MIARIISLILLLFSTSAFAGLFDPPGQAKFVAVDKAFIFDFQQSGTRLTLNWQIKPGYYLYRQQISLRPDQASLAPLNLPQATWHEDAFYGKTEIYTGQLNLPVTIQSAAPNASVSVTYQGCAEAGFCYPPETRTIPLTAVTDAQNNPQFATVNAQQQNPVIAPQSPTAQREPFSLFWAFLIGIGLAFTPCVLPMYPLLSGIVLGSAQRLSPARALLLIFIYIQGMALTYTALGLVVAAAGLSFQAVLQHPYVLIVLSALFIVLAASMFGLFTLQLPVTLQTRLTLLSQRQQAGSAGGVFAMGALAGLICSPCTTAPLSAILLYIAQSGNIWRGGVTLYLYALGMGLPLMLITLFGHRLLPKSGPWMVHVKTAFGFVTLAVPVFLLERILGEEWSLRLWGTLGIALFGWAFITSLQAKKSWIRIVQIILLAMTLICARPLQDWVFGYHTTASQPQLNFTPINSIAELNQTISNARGKPVMLDFYADWCVACKDFETQTFSDPQVQQLLANTVLLRANVTANSQQNTALLKHLQVLGLPTLLFFDSNGKEQSQVRVTGFMDALAFRNHLQSFALRENGQN